MGRGPRELSLAVGRARKRPDVDRTIQTTEQETEKANEYSNESSHDGLLDTDAFHPTAVGDVWPPESGGASVAGAGPRSSRLTVGANHARDCCSQSFS